MMNNPLVIEQARRWADRVQLESWPTANERIGSMYLTAFGRPAMPEEIAEAMDTTVPAVKSLLVRARISLAAMTVLGFGPADLPELDVFRG